jgi:hypothetical protein
MYLKNIQACHLLITEGNIKYRFYLLIGPLLTSQAMHRIAGGGPDGLCADRDQRDEGCQGACSCEDPGVQGNMIGEILQPPV